MILTGEIFGVIPRPLFAESGDGWCDFGLGFEIAAPEEFEGEADHLRIWLEEEVKRLPPPSIPEIQTEDPHSPYSSELVGLASDDDNSDWEPRVEDVLVPEDFIPPKVMIRFIHDQGVSDPEGYILKVDKDRVELRAARPAGAFYAAVTLRQLAMSGAGLVFSGRVEDAPRFAWRGFMLDCARNFFRVEFIERMLELAAFHKLNRFHWHLTDDQAWRIGLDRHPELAEKGAFRLDGRFNRGRELGGFYSPADMRRVVEKAASLHIEVVPEVETPGHAIAILASHPELGCAQAGRPTAPADRYGVFEDILCAGNSAVFDLLDEVFDELAAIFPFGVVHAGGDEVPKVHWLSCPRCKARMDELGFFRDSPSGRAYDAERLQGWFMDNVAALLKKRGKRMAGWDEILDSGAERSALIMSWRGEGGGVAGADAGYDVVMCPQTKACYLDHKQADSPEEPGHIGVCTLEDSYRFDPVPKSLGGAAASRILGGQANIWTELMYFGRQVEYMAFPRLSALAEVFWSAPEHRNWESFAMRLERFHGPRLDILGVNRRRG